MLEERPLKSRGRSCRGKRWHLATLGLAPQGRSLNLARPPRGPGIGIVNVDLKWLGSSKARSGLGSQARRRHGLCFQPSTDTAAPQEATVAAAVEVVQSWPTWRAKRSRPGNLRA